jgi:protease IV
MRELLSFLATLITALPRWLFTQLLSRAIYKRRAVHIEITAENVKSMMIGESGLQDFLKLQDLENLRLVCITIHQTPSGWANCLALRNAIKSLRSKNKIVWVHLLSPLRDGIYISSAADKVFSRPHTSLFWNGVGSRILFYSGLLEKVGIRADIESAGEYKSFGESYTRRFPTSQNREQLHSIYSGLENHMLEVMAESTGISQERLSEAFYESPLSSDQAEKLGLIHGQAYKNQFVDSAKKFVGIQSDMLTLNQASRYRRWNESFKKFGDFRQSVVVVSLKGTVVEYGEGVQISSEKVVPLLDGLKDNNTVSAVVLKINSPGGSAVASDVIANAITNLSLKKPVIALMENVAASGGYYIAARCNEIIAYPTTITGSIGVVGGKVAIGEGLERIGIQSEEISASGSTGLFGLYHPFNEHQRQRSFLQLTYDRFLEVVSTGRKLPLDTVKSIAEGRVWTGQQALDLRLVDYLGDEQTAINHAARRCGVHPRNLKVKRFKFVPTLRQRIRNQLNGQAKSSIPMLIKPLVESSPFWKILFHHPMEALMIFDFDESNDTQI